MKMTGDDTTEGDELGHAVAIDVRAVVAGAQYHALTTTGDEGAAYYFKLPS